MSRTVRTPNFKNITKRLRDRDQRGAALVEFAIAIPILIALLAIVFDAGLGYTAARTSSSAARSAARVGALAGDARLADFRALDALKAQFGDGSSVNTIYIYKSDALTNPDGLPPFGSCTAATKCTQYAGTVLATLNQADFGVVNAGLPTETCAPGAKDINWCPLHRRVDDGSYLGVFVQSTSEATIGAVSPDSFELANRSVFALYFPPLPAIPTPTPATN